MKPRNPVLLVVLALFHLGGMFVMPFLFGFVAALFLEVSEVAETAPVLLGFSLLYLFPLFCMQAAAAIIKTRRELRELKESGRQHTLYFLDVLVRHLAIVTPRGWSFLGIGLFFLLLALAFRWAELGTMAVLAFVVFYGVVGLSAILSTLFVRGFERSLASRRGSISRQMSPAVVLAGEMAEERFTVARVYIPPGYSLLIEDSLPEKLESESRHVIGGRATREQLTVSGRLRRTPRGLYALGPARIWFQDFLGLTRVSVATVACASLKIIPRFCDLVIVRPPRSSNQSNDVVSRPHRFPTDDYFRIKEYATGDDTRRIHWRLSVRAGRLQVRLPETREVSVDTIVLALDTFMSRAAMPHAIGVETVLDRLVETWLAMARRLVEAGERVTLVAAATQSDGNTAIERISASRNSATKWQDLGARVVWQPRHDLPELLAEVGPGTRGVAVSARFDAPPTTLLPDQSLSWIYYPPELALGNREPPLWSDLVGPGEGVSGRTLSAVFRVPFPAGSPENGFLFQLRGIFAVNRLRRARSYLRILARRRGQTVLGTLIARGDTVYRLEPGARTHRIVAVSGDSQLGAPS